MARFVMLTDEPERLRSAYGSFPGWSVTDFSSAVDALVWERRMRRDGAFVLDSRGWRHGVVFSRENGDSYRISPTTFKTRGAEIR